MLSHNWVPKIFSDISLYSRGYMTPTLNSGSGMLPAEILSLLLMKWPSAVKGCRCSPKINDCNLHVSGKNECVL